MEMQKSTRIIKQEVLKELCDLLTSGDFPGFAETLGAMPAAVNIHALTVADDVPINWAYEQHKDPDFDRIFQLLKSTKLCNVNVPHEASGVKKYLAHWKTFIIRNDVLYKNSNSVMI